MSNSTSYGFPVLDDPVLDHPVLDDDEHPPLDASPSSAAVGGAQPDVSRTPPAASVPMPRRADPVAGSALRPAQRACSDALSVGLKEAHVFAALTGPGLSGKTTVLEAVIAGFRDWPLRWIRIRDPDQVPAKLAEQIEQVAYAEARKPENRERQVVLVVDDAHNASEELMRCLTRLAAMREPGRRVPQLLLIGRPELWTRLAAEEFGPLERRLAIRAELPLPETDDDPWSSVEHEVTRPALRLRPEAATRPARRQAPVCGVPPSPSVHPLFPAGPPRSASQARGRKRHHRPLLALGALSVAAAATILLLSFDLWPDRAPRLPWARTDPAAQLEGPQAQVESPLQPAEPPVASPPLTADASSAPAPTPLATPAPPAPEPPEPLPPQVAEASAPASAPAAVPQPVPQPVPQSAPRTAEAPLAPEIIALLLRRGGEQAEIGDLSAARLLYMRAAEAGSARGALLTARTYDEAFLPPADANTLADRAAARTWYARAAVLGDAEALSRLRAMDN